MKAGCHFCHSDCMFVFVSLGTQTVCEKKPLKWQPCRAEEQARGSACRYWPQEAAAIHRKKKLPQQTGNRLSMYKGQTECKQIQGRDNAVATVRCPCKRRCWVGFLATPLAACARPFSLLPTAETPLQPALFYTPPNRRIRQPFLSKISWLCLG